MLARVTAKMLGILFDTLDRAHMTFYSTLIDTQCRKHYRPTLLFCCKISRMAVILTLHPLFLSVWNLAHMLFYPIWW